MLLDLNKLHGQREHFERRFEPSVFEPHDPDYRVIAPVELSLDVEKSGGGAFRVSGTTATTLELDCSRCVEPFTLAVSSPFDLQYVPAEQDSSQGEREIQDDDLTTAYYREGSLDLLELVREQFQLALPMKPLCSDACRGLCLECGGNLNRTDCGHEPTWVDPRLEVLKGLLNKDQ
jgi:uncharacterized protein